MSRFLSFLKHVLVESSAPWDYLRVLYIIGFPQGASALFILTISSEAFVSPMLLHGGWRHKLRACNKLPDSQKGCIFFILCDLSPRADKVVDSFPRQRQLSVCIHCAVHAHKLAGRCRLYLRLHANIKAFKRPKSVWPYIHLCPR